jgi:predicted nucleotidyltransferase
MNKMEKNDLKIITESLEKIFQKKKEVLFCYLFGSFAYRNFNSKSDVDVAVFLDKKNKVDFFEKRLELTSEISRALKKETDILILNTAPLFLKYVVLKEGKLIFSRNENQRIGFELKTMNDYFDFKPILKKYNQRTLARIKKI